MINETCNDQSSSEIQFKRFESAKIFTSMSIVRCPFKSQSFYYSLGRTGNVRFCSWKKDNFFHCFSDEQGLELFHSKEIFL